MCLSCTFSLTLSVSLPLTNSPSLSFLFLPAPPLFASLFGVSFYHSFKSFFIFLAAVSFRSFQQVKREQVGLDVGRQRMMTCSTSQYLSDNLISLTTSDNALVAASDEKISYHSSSEIAGSVPSEAEGSSFALEVADDTEWLGSNLLQNFEGDESLEDIGSRQYICFHCGKAFRHHSNRSRHQKMCRQVYLVPCHLCDQAFGRTDNLKAHLRRVHGVGEQLDCIKCGKRFRSKVKLDEHILVCDESSM